MAEEQQRLGKRLKGYRKLKGMTQVDLSRATDISVSVMGEIERGVRLPTPETLEKIAEALEVSIAELTMRKEEKVIST
ncbi:helix-turn-helix domain-containing protein [Thalassobacillus hwangdonensis]|uniref:Helix-turn-helix domain-containing protein n=1 Tax=Thalassobacillus hwangdonensis TaxID=546108 RepID=A0ABW3L576_9BACI